MTHNTAYSTKKTKAPKLHLGLNDGKMLKTLFKNDKFAQMVYNIEEIPITKNVLQNDVVIFVTTKMMGNQFQTLQLLIEALEGQYMIILMSEKEEIYNELYEKLEIQINQPIYFYKMPTKELFETYSINNQKIKRKLGFISSKNTNFFWESNISSNFMKRRSNFHGLTLKVMVEFSGSSMNVDPTYIEKSPYFSNNKTYKVNGYTYGIFNDVLETLQSQLNFTSNLYKRKKAAWGYVYPQPNGTFRGTGNK